MRETILDDGPQTEGGLTDHCDSYWSSSVVSFVHGAYFISVNSSILIQTSGGAGGTGFYGYAIFYYFLDDTDQINGKLWVIKLMASFGSVCVKRVFQGKTGCFHNNIGSSVIFLNIGKTAVLLNDKSC